MRLPVNETAAAKCLLEIQAGPCCVPCKISRLARHSLEQPKEGWSQWDFAAGRLPLFQHLAQSLKRSHAALCTSCFVLQHNSFCLTTCLRYICKLSCNLCQGKWRVCTAHMKQRRRALSCGKPGKRRLGMPSQPSVGSSRSSSQACH